MGNFFFEKSFFDIFLKIFKKQFKLENFVCKTLAKVLRMKKFNLLNDEKQNVERPLIEINEKSIWKNSENIQHEKKIKFTLEDIREEKQNELSVERESKEIKLKFIAIVFDRLFFITASVYTIITFFVLLMSI